ncbi:hypothetical protein M1L60_08430 [Actinoplanes sp. TRM 88003]|uniref:Calx-beta domain-containing protein n=1 Tax=Paractinoplanes aksuensis TaxID=2939490 RepID=A0ABT1DIG9_9ACTN|nr:Calx-beta domain-containing protein [Actinoplanes aksuensis]MCO8270623.1 hypothetical protein [Actinoplanes aksuensis]
MRYPKAHADSSGSVPFALRGSKSARTVLATAVAGAIGLVPVAYVASPASAAPDATMAVSASAAAAEGANVTFTLTPTVPGTWTISTIAGSPNGAVAGTDYTALTVQQQTAVFSTTAPQTITIATTDDSLYEANETFVLRATNANGTDWTEATATINDNDTAPSYTLTAAPNPVVEAVNAKATVTAKLSAISGLDSVVTLNTANGTAIAGADYTALTNQTVTIAAGSLTGTAEILITNDNKKDQLDTESFTVSGTATNVSPTAATTTVNITDAQSTPKLTLSSGGATTEGQNATFTVTTDTVSELPITVQWNAVETVPVSGHWKATPGDDFTYPANRTVTIPAGSTTAAITIPTIADQTDELDEDYTIELASPTNAVLGAVTKVTSTITDSDNAPTVTFTPTSVVEGNSGKKTHTFTATLSAKSGKTVQVDWKTNPTGATYGDAVAGKDYVAANGRLSFEPGTTTKTVTVDIIGDTIDEGPVPRTNAAGEGEKFQIVPSAVVGDVTASLGNSATAVITIADDDAMPTATFDDVKVKEGTDASAVLAPIKLTGSSDHPITFAVADAGTGTAKSTIGTTIGDNDYNLLNTSVTIAPEMSNGYAVVLVNGDHMYEADETVDLTATPGATTAGADWLTAPAADPATVTLLNDDGAPDLEINSVMAKEGEKVEVTGTVTGSSSTSTTLTVSFAGASVKGSRAADAADFENPGAKVITIPAGTVPGTVMPVQSIWINADKLPEPAETILGTGVGLGNVGTVTDGVITIAANDGSEPGEPGEAPKPTINAPMSVNGTGPVSITGKVAANAAVELWGAPVSGGELKWIANTKASAMGMYSFSRSISQGMRFVTQSQEVNSVEKTVWVNQWASLTATSPSKGRVSVVVKTNPNASGRKVVVQRWTGPNTWTNILVSKANVNGAYTATTVVPSGTVALRAWVDGAEDWGINGGWSDIVRPVIK